MARTVFALFLLSAVPLHAVTPMGKVISLITDLKTQVEEEGTEEASVYDAFACFCKDTTMSKSTSITDGQDKIGELSADIGSKTAEKASKETELGDRKAKQNQLQMDLKESQVRCAKTKAEYEANNADLEKAISGLNGAMGALGSAKPSLISIKDTIEKSLALASVLGLKPQQNLAALLQVKVDPSDPSYKYHSQGILDTVNKLLVEFQQTKADADTEWAKTKKACDEEQASLADQIESNANAIAECKSTIMKLKGDIAAARGNLVSEEGLLKDAQAYLQDLTERCESRAKDWDQRSQMRADELTSLTEALAILTDKAKDMDTAANKRALLQANTHTPAKAAVAFVQESSTSSGQVRRLVLHDHTEFTKTAKKQRAAEILRAEGLRLKSSILSSLASQAAADPFGKVLKLVQDLIERLVAEATAEATKKGFCDTELGKAEKDRSFRLADINKLNVEIAGLEVMKDELEAEIEELTAALTNLNEQLVTAEADRKAEKAVNLKTLKDAKAGHEAVTDAIAILKQFYKQAAKATVFLQASPVDEDTSGAGFSGAYKGNQKKAVGIFGLLEVIKSDFDRTLRTTEAAEKESAAAFVKFDRVSRTDIAGKETKKALDAEDLETTKNKIAQGLTDLQTNTDLLDSALKTIEDLKPTCIDTTMTYDERVAKREEEMTALRKALCILDTDAVEADCSP